MDRKWMQASRDSEEYELGVDEFLTYARRHNIDCDSTGVICPCRKCNHLKMHTPKVVEYHLFQWGIDPTYIVWFRHCEVDLATCGDHEADVVDSSINSFMDVDGGDRVEKIPGVLEVDFRDFPKLFETLKIDATPLYNGSRYTKLSAVLNLFKLKAENGWSDKSFTELLALLGDMLPEENVLPVKTYEAKRMMCAIGMGYERIHVCPNDCILYRGELSDPSVKNCPKCKAPRYKKEEGQVPVKVMWYFPLIPRLRRLFQNVKDAKLLTWHATREKKDNKMRHLADSPQWQKFHADYEEFGSDPRNLHFVLGADGFNPHGNQSSTLSTWPGILINYNLPPWLCMKQKYMMLNFLISGPKQPGNDIDVFLEPLLDDLKLLWEQGVQVFDAHKEENFTLKAMLYGTINDFPAYGNLSGCAVKGYLACPICQEETDSIRLIHSNKIVYLGPRKFTNRRHPYRRLRKAFNGSTKERVAGKPLTGKQVREKVKDLKVTFGKTFAKNIPGGEYKKNSIFFKKLDYWETLYVRHNLDVMHIEKNVCDSVIGTLLNVPGKTKDHARGRLDMVNMKIRSSLAPTKKNGRTFLPPTAHTLSRKEKLAFCEFLRGVKVPEGYSSNIRNRVSMKDLKLIGLKSHDCHILMEYLLPVALRGILPKRVSKTLTQLCLFFRSLCSRVIDPEKLQLLENQIIQTLCELEMYFPPSFFDIMVHLTVHLVREVKLCGPVFFRWMYPIQRYMKVLKGYVKNRSRPEGCIVERYIVEEAVEFCTEFLSEAHSLGLPQSRHVGRTDGKGISGWKLVELSDTQIKQAHLYVLRNSVDVEPFVDEHKQILRHNNPSKSEQWISRAHINNFAEWLKMEILETDKYRSVSRRVACLAGGPRDRAFSYSSYMINGYTFYTKDQDNKSTMQNSGVALVAEAMHVSSSKDKNPIYSSMSYYGVIKNILDLDYGEFRLPVFECCWVENNSGVRIDESGFTLVEFGKVGETEEPFILASQAVQLFYVRDPADQKRWVVMSTKKKNVVDERDDFATWDDDEEVVNWPQYPAPATSEDEDEVYLREDHSEGIW